LSGVTEYQVKVPKEVMDLLVSGNRRRTTESTKANQTSSRSHAIFTLYVESRSRVESSEKITYSKLHLVDLAGSERTKKTGTSGK
jgi:kinesin family protein 6/9